MRIERFESYSTSSGFVPPCVRRGAGQAGQPWAAPYLKILDSAVSGERGKDFEEGTAFVDGNGDADILLCIVADDTRRWYECGVDGRVIQNQ